MAGIRLEWAQFGDFDSFDVIRSTTSMMGIADEDLPSPIATNLNTMYFADTVSLTEDETYYYKIRAWRDDVSVLSDELKTIANPVLSILLVKNGYFFNANYLDSMFQDKNGTIPAEIDMPVGRINCLNSNVFAYADTNPLRPTLKQDAYGYYLEFNGSNSLMIDSVNINSNKVSTFLSLSTNNSTTVQMIHETSENLNTYKNGFYLALDTDPGVDGNSYQKVTLLATGSSSVSYDHIAYSAQTLENNTYSVIATMSIADDLSSIMVNMVDGVSATADMGAGAFATKNHYIGSRANSNVFFDGKLRVLGCVFDIITSDEIGSIDNYLSQYRE